MTQLRLLVVIAACFVALSTTGAAWAAPTTIDFESFTGPSVFSNAEPPLTVGAATFSGGMILTAVTGLMSNSSTVYGTASFCTGCASSITITFSTPVSEVSAEVLNGIPGDVSYTVSSNLGDSVTKSLGLDIATDHDTFTFPGPGITSVTVTTTTPNPARWDFFVDNISFNESPTSNPFPTSKSECKDGGWRGFGLFKNQGDCVSYVATEGRNPPG